jgi:hypothetical protein
LTRPPNHFFADRRHVCAPKDQGVGPIIGGFAKLS